MQVQVLPYGSTEIALHTARVAAWGERLAVLLVAAAIGDQGIQTTPVRDEMLVTTFPWQQHEPPCLDELASVPILMSETCTRARRLLLPLFTAQMVPVVAGKLGRTSKRILTTQGEDSVASTAALLAEMLHASVVEIYAEHEGLLTADPAVVSDASPLPTLFYDEAWQLASFASRAPSIGAETSGCQPHPLARTPSRCP